MLPLISEEALEKVFNEIDDIHAWRKRMVHFIKDENPEVNTAIIEIANRTSLDPKAVATGAYVLYKMLDLSAQEEKSTLDALLEDS